MNLKPSSIQQKIELLNELVKEEKIFTFLNWVEIKSAQTNEQEIENIIFASLKFTDSVKYKKEFFWSFDSDYFTFLRFCSIMLRKISSIENRRKLIFRQISNLEKDFTFSSFYIADEVIRAKQLLEEKKLSYDHRWQTLFSEDSEDNNKFIEDIEQIKKVCGKALFEKEIETKCYLNEDELGLILFFIQEAYSDLYYQNFSFLINDDHDLIKYLWICIKPYYMTSNSWVGYQVARHQFMSGMDIEEIKIRIEHMDNQNFDFNENLILNLFLKAYDDGFLEKRHYNLETLDIVTRDFG